MRKPVGVILLFSGRPFLLSLKPMNPPPQQPGTGVEFNWKGLGGAGHNASPLASARSSLPEATLRPRLHPRPPQRVDQHIHPARHAPRDEVGRLRSEGDVPAVG